MVITDNSTNQRQQIQVSIEGVTRFVTNMGFATPTDALFEFLGSWPKKVNNWSLDTSRINGQDFMIMCGDDNGLSIDDIDRSKQVFKSGNNGHS